MEANNVPYIDLHPTYQISFSAEDVGKRMAATKREIRWRFGFPNVQALNAGETGPVCRGEEHEVVIFWSITSGKKVVILDNQEIHNSTGRVNTFFHSFIVRGRHVVKIEANLTRHDNLNQYDLWIDGVSFSKMPKVFQLGIKGAVPNENNHPVPGPVPGPVPVYAPARVERPMPPATSGRQYDFARGQYIDPPSSAKQEEEDLQKAIARSIEDSRNHLVTKGKEAPPPVQVTAPKQPDLLIDFFSDPIPAPQPVQQPVNTSYSNNTWGSQQNNVYGMGYPAPSPAAPVYDQHSHMHGGGYPSSSPAVPSYSDPFSTSVQQNQPVATQSHSALYPQQQPSQNNVVENPFAVAPKVQSTYTSPAPYSIHGSNPFAENPFSPAPSQQQTANNNQYAGYSNQQQAAPAPAAYNGYQPQGQPTQYQQYGYGYPTPPPPAGVAAPGSIQGYSNPAQQNQPYGNYQF